MSTLFNHMELSVPLGILTEDFCADVTAFYSDVYGFDCAPGEMFDQKCVHMTLPNGSFILLIEGDTPMSSPGFDHLGFEQSSMAEVDETLDKVKRWAQKDSRVQIREYPDGNLHGRRYRAYYVRHLLPIWFDVQFSAPIAEWPQPS